MWSAIVEKLSLKCPVAESVPSNLPNASSCAGQYRKCVHFLFLSTVWSVLKESSKIYLERQKLFLIWLHLLLLSLLYPWLGRWRLAIILPIRYLWHRGFVSRLPVSWGRYVSSSSSNAVVQLIFSNHLWYVLKYLSEAVSLENFTSKRKKNIFCWGVGWLCSAE